MGHGWVRGMSSSLFNRRPFANHAAQRIVDTTHRLDDMVYGGDSIPFGRLVLQLMLLRIVLQSFL